jgi:hypothetical protein
MSSAALNHRRGMSLIELGVASLLGVLVLGIMVQFFVSALHIGQRSVMRSRLQQTGTTALLAMIQDLQQANAGGLTFRPDAQLRMIHCIIHPVDDISGDGLPQYSSQVLIDYFLAPAQRLLKRRTFDAKRPSPIPLRSGEPMRFTPQQIDILQQGRAREKLYPGVASLTISTPGVEPEFVGNPLRIELILQEGREEVHCIRSVVLRNSL